MNIHSISRSCRYYGTAKELNFLISNINQYFSYPERSPERTHFATFISNHLKKSNSHWTLRAVRLWFNNNKKTYLNPENSNKKSSKNFSTISPHKIHIIKDSSDPSICLNSSFIDPSSSLRSTLQFHGFDILSQTARSFSVNEPRFENIEAEINTLCKNYNIDTISSLQNNIPIIFFPHFCKHKFDIMNLIHLDRFDTPYFWLSPPFIQNLTFPFDTSQNSLEKSSIFSSNNGNDQQISKETITNQFLTFLSSEHSVSINNHNLSYKNTFSKDPWILCSLPSNITDPITSIFPLSSDHFFLVDSSQIYLIQIDSLSKDSELKDLDLKDLDLKDSYSSNIIKQFDLNESK